MEKHKWRVYLDADTVHVVEAESMFIDPGTGIVFKSGTKYVAVYPRAIAAVQQDAFCR